VELEERAFELFSQVAGFTTSPHQGVGTTAVVDTLNRGASVELVADALDERPFASQGRTNQLYPFAFHVLTQPSDQLHLSGGNSRADADTSAGGADVIGVLSSSFRRFR
jgi:hypothetical protein